MLSHILEVRKFLDKNLLCDIQVASTEYQMFDRIIKTDKWLRFEDWQQLYEKLDKVLQIHSSPHLEKLYAQNFQISNNAEVYIEKSPLEKAYCEICSLEEDELLPIVLTIKVNKIDINALNKKISKLEKHKKSCKNCITRDKVKIRVRKDLCREYDPVQVSGGGQNNVPPYKPYKPSVKTDSQTDNSESRQEKEEYSPKPVGSASDKFDFEGNVEGSLDCYNPNTADLPDQDVPPYIPSEIKSLPDVKEEIEEISSTSDILSPDLKTKESRSTVSLRSTRKRQYLDLNTSQLQETPESVFEEGRATRSKRKKGDDGRLSQDLFGSDDSEHDIDLKLKNSGSPDDAHMKKDKSKDHKKIAKPGKSKLEHSEETSSKRHYKDYTKSDDIRRKATSKNEKVQVSSKENGRQSRKKHKSSKSSQSQSTNVTPSKPKLTEEEKQRSRDNHEKEIEILKNYKEEIQALNKSPPAMDIINLDHLKSEELVATFGEFKHILDGHFKEHIKRKTHVVKAMENIDHLLMMSVIEDNKLFPLLNHLKENYETDAANNMPSYTDLFMNLLLPEWILAIFMKEHKLSRLEAIERIKAQNQLESSNNSFS